MLSSSGPANMAGNKVSTSIFMSGTRSRRRTAHCAGLSSTISIVQRTPLRALPACNSERMALIVMPCRPMTRPDVARREANLVNGLPAAFHRGNRHRIGVFDKALDHIFHKGLHGPGI